jgi:hypothetical protein
MDHKKFGTFSNLGASNHCLNGLKVGPTLSVVKTLTKKKINGLHEDLFVEFFIFINICISDCFTVYESL